MSMTWDNFILELLKVIITWPFTVLVLGFFFFRKFQGAITNFMSVIAWRISHLRGPGGTEAVLQNPSYDPALLQEIQRAHQNEKAWFFTYLNVFFVLTTKQALILIALNGANGINSKDLFAKLRGVNPNITQQEFDVILQVLNGYGMILSENDVLCTSPLGVEYLNFFIRSAGISG